MAGKPKPKSLSLYSIDIRLTATAYVKATSKREAMATLARRYGRDCSIEDIRDDVSGASFDNPDLPALSISPAMTSHGRWPGAALEIAETDVPASPC